MAHGKSYMVRSRRCWPACEPCATAHKEYLRQRYVRQSLRTQDKRIDATRTRERLVTLRTTYKMTDVEIGRRIGMSNIHVGRIARGQTSVVYTSKARAIYNLYREASRVSAVREHWNPMLTSADKCHLAIRGLMAQGYSRIWLGEKLNLDLDTIWKLTRDRDHPKARLFVRRATEDAVLALARDIGSTPGPSNYTKAIAKRSGWLPTMYHDALV